MPQRQLSTAEAMIERAMRETDEQEVRFTLRQALQLLVGLEERCPDGREAHAQ